MRGRVGIGWISTAVGVFVGRGSAVAVRVGRVSGRAVCTAVGVEGGDVGEAASFDEKSGVHAVAIQPINKTITYRGEKINLFTRQSPCGMFTISSLSLFSPLRHREHRVFLESKIFATFIIFTTETQRTQSFFGEQNFRHFHYFHH
jgi:hypothetical protein